MLDRVPADRRPLVAALRRTIRATVPHATETLLWGGLSYHRPEIGGRVKGSVCQITWKGAGVRLEFIHGVKLPDPAKLLEGRLRSKRFVPIASQAEASRPQVVTLIREAASIVWGP
jgi:hypothetical protein